VTIIFRTSEKTPAVKRDYASEAAIKGWLYKQVTNNDLRLRWKSQLRYCERVGQNNLTSSSL
jgi:hypothetical protein